MTQEDKDLLLNDLCGRIPYGVKFVIDNDQNNVRTLTGICEAIPYEDWQMCAFARGIRAIPIEDIKPYLFPMSKVVEEVVTTSNKHIAVNVDFFHKNHIDYRGLIEKGLANDATGLNIY